MIVCDICRKPTHDQRMWLPFLDKKNICCEDKIIAETATIQPRNADICNNCLRKIAIYINQLENETREKRDEE